MEARETEEFANEWIRAWNARDLDTLLAHYSDDVEFRSLVAVKLLGDPAGMVRGKQNLREYFRKALAAYPGDLDAQLLGVFRGVDSLVVHFEVKGFKAAEVMELDPQGKVRRASAHARI
jgi:hypothetical protein